jgi:hypothetical protein
LAFALFFRTRVDPVSYQTGFHKGFVAAQLEFHAKQAQDSAKREQWLSEIERSGIADVTYKLKAVEDRVLNHASMESPAKRVDCSKQRQVVAACMESTKGDPLSCHSEVDVFHKCALQNVQLAKKH